VSGCGGLGVVVVKVLETEYYRNGSTVCYLPEIDAVPRRRRVLI